MISPDSIPLAAAVPVSALLWLYLVLVNRREQRSANTARTILIGASSLEGVLTQGGEDSALDDDVEHDQRDGQGDQRGDDSSDIHARIVSCPCLNRSELLSGYKCEHTR